MASRIHRALHGRPLGTLPSSALRGPRDPLPWGHPLRRALRCASSTAPGAAQGDDARSAPARDAVRVPVLIVGGGPVGMYLSLLLSRYGVPSLLVERSEEGAENGRAGPTTHPEGGRSLDQGSFWHLSTTLGGGGVGTRPRYLIGCLWRRPLASRHCSF